MAMAFLLYSDQHGLEAYERDFRALNSKFRAGAALQASRKFIRDECQKNGSLKRFLRDEIKDKEFTARVVDKFNLRHVIEAALKRT